MKPKGAAKLSSAEQGQHKVMWPSLENRAILKNWDYNRITGLERELLGESSWNWYHVQCTAFYLYTTSKDLLNYFLTYLLHRFFVSRQFGRSTGGPLLVHCIHFLQMNHWTFTSSAPLILKTQDHSYSEELEVRNIGSTTLWIKLVSYTGLNLSFPRFIFLFKVLITAVWLIEGVT